MEKRIEINKRRLAEWWLLLNRWETPQELLLGDKKMNYDMVRGAFQVVNSMINLKEIKKIKPKVKV